MDGEEVSRLAEAVTMARDLINRPANDLGPAELEQEARNLAARFGAAFSVVKGEELLRQNFPMIHAVGMGSPRAPRLIDLTWGDPAHPKVTLVGKGVCFDTGGLDIKPDSAMLLMKKDMGGAAAALAGAFLVMASGLPVRLRLLIPAVENAVSAKPSGPVIFSPPARARLSKSAIPMPRAGWFWLMPSVLLMRKSRPCSLTSPPSQGQPVSPWGRIFRPSTPMTMPWPLTLPSARLM